MKGKFFGTDGTSTVLVFERGGEVVFDVVVVDVVDVVVDVDGSMSIERLPIR